MRTEFVICVMVLLASTGCERERRDFNSRSGLASPGTAVAQTPTGLATADSVSPFRGNAYGLSEGKRLYGWFNCVGCHHHGGGGIGPALMDHRWIYGHQPSRIYQSIVEGRPNGMPSYGGRLTDQQVWQIVAYVESLSGNVPKDAAPGRDDDMASSPPEASREPRPPVQTGHR
jgi:cytochrome c oxidase cbb3-type subunit III